MWRAYNPNHNNPVGIGSVFNLAKKFGWFLSPFAVVEGGFAITGTAERTARYRLCGADDPRRYRHQWVVAFLPNRGLAAIYGPSGSGKTFLILDLAVLPHFRDYWFGFRTKQNSRGLSWA